MADKYTKNQTENKEEIIKLINSFELGLTSWQKGHYIYKLNKYFLDYVIEEYPTSTLQEIFEKNFNEQNIIKATVRFVEKNKKIHSVSMMEGFLNALSSFFDKVIFKQYDNTNLKKSYPFITLSSKVKEQVKLFRDLDEPKTKDELNQKEIEFILEHIKNIELKKSKTINKETLLKHIIIKVAIKYGLSFLVLNKLTCGDYIDGCLKIKTKYKEVDIFLKLENEIKNDLNNYLYKRFGDVISDENKKENLFVNAKNIPIKNDFVNSYLKNLQKKYNEQYKTKSIFTHTGLCKSALIQMITINKVDMYFISQLTENKNKIIDDCYSKALMLMGNEKFSENINEQLV